MMQNISFYTNYFVTFGVIYLEKVFFQLKHFMIIIEVKEGESIDRALRRYKRKHRNVKLRRELMDRKYYTKPSVERRNEVLNAAYRLKKFNSN